MRVTYSHLLDSENSNLRPTVIFLNGAPSSGKTSIAQQLKRILDQPYDNLLADDFLPAEFRTLLETGHRHVGETLKTFDSASAWQNIEKRDRALNE